MLEQCLIKQCAPTLASIKTANLFSYRISAEKPLEEEVSELDSALRQKGVEMRVLREHGESALIYVFRPQRLSQALRDREASSILRECGYESCDMEAAMETLTKRLNGGESFPHEIGVFLGYPAEDVRGFIRNAGKNCKCCGYWKIYGDEREALNTFRRYSECREKYEKLWRSGMSAQQLTVCS